MFFRIVTIVFYVAFAVFAFFGISLALLIAGVMAVLLALAGIFQE